MTATDGLSSSTTGGSSRFRVRLMPRIVLCCCIALNTLTCGSCFCFPLFGPVLTRRMGLTMSQTNYISLGAVVGQYVAAVFFGAIADKSARISSLCSAILLSSGYTMMSISLSRHLPPNFLFFIGYFVLVGAGTVASYLAAITASAKSFPDYPGLAIGIPSALFGTSPLLLSTVASALFTVGGNVGGGRGTGGGGGAGTAGAGGVEAGGGVSSTGEGIGEIDAVRLFAFFAVLLGLVNLTSALAMKPIPHTPEELQGVEEVVEDEDGEVHAQNPRQVAQTSQPHSRPTPQTTQASSETQPLLPQASVAQPHAATHHASVRAFLRQRTVWTFIAIVLLLNGPSEVIQQNLGSLSEALVPISPSTWPDHATLSSRARQIQIFSAVNTLSRLIFGALSDLTSPANASSPTAHRLQRRFATPRLTYLQASAWILLLASLYTASFIDSTDKLWLLSSACGLSYGLINVVGPSLVAKIWGEQDFGRNFGVLWCIGAVGPIFYALLYGRISDHFARRQQHEACRGRICFQHTFLVIATGAFLSLGLIWALKRRKAWQKV